MVSLIAGLPGLIALAVCLRHDTERAFLWVYLPTLLLLPDGYRWPVLGHLTFHEAAILPIAVWFLASSWRTWKVSLCDVLLAGYCAVTIISQVYNRSVHDARTTMLRDVTYLLFPYMLAKGLLRRDRFGLEVARCVAILLAIASIVSLYEFKMTVNPFESLVRPFFPSREEQMLVFRYGLKRVAGPFGNELAAGIILLAGYRVVRWLEWSGNWRRRIPLLDISAVRFCEVSILVGAVMTIARGAWLGAAFAFFVVLVGRARDRVRTLALIMAAVVVLGPPVYWAVHSYLSPSSLEQLSLDEDTAVYRVQLLFNYLPIIAQRPALGYGESWSKDAFTVVNGQSSIDNNYLLVALTYGVLALGLWIMLFMFTTTRLIWFALRRPRDDLRGSLAYSLAGACTVYGVASTTVALGAQTLPLLCIIWGWGEGLLGSPFLAAERKAQNVALVTPMATRYRKVLAGVIVSNSQGVPG
jgi:hypothetical protein